MDRRLKDRLPPVLTAPFRRLPQLALIVTATIFLSPAAMAQIASSKVAPVWTTYSKDELKKTMPANPVTTLEGRVLSEVNELFKRMTAAQTDPLKALAVTQPDKTTTLVQMAALKDPPVRAATNVDGIRGLLAGEMQKAGSAQGKRHFNYVDKFNSGLGFNLDIASVFGGGKKEGQKAEGTVRYGLVLEEINPDPNAPQRAAVGDMQSEMAFAGHADVKWSIGPIDEAHGRKLFNVADVDAKSEQGMMKYLPKPGFNGKVTPENFENLAKVNKDNMPAWRLDLSQEQGYYTLIYRTKPSGERLSEEHQFMAPIGDMKVGRRFNDKFEVIQTSAYNILIDKRLPLISIHQMHIEERYTADCTYVIDGHSIGVTARAEAKGKVTDEATRPEGYTLNYGKSF